MQGDSGRGGEGRKRDHIIQFCIGLAAYSRNLYPDKQMEFVFFDGCLEPECQESREVGYRLLTSPYKQKTRATWPFKAWLKRTMNHRGNVTARNTGIDIEMYSNIGYYLEKQR